ncbi:MAG: SsrA-binding protein SmpB [Actinobacteria bacterium]|nr:SsrA-binding protein SmpB [Actinomycetota bacterium]
MAGQRDGEKVVATNRQARRDYEVLDTFQCGLVLRGAEVKSLREAKVQLADTYARLVDDEVWIHGLHISPYSHAARQGQPEPDRDRKLLLHRHEIDELRDRLARERLALVPLRLYFKDGKAKLELGIGRGRRQIDKRQLLAKREADLEARRAMARAGRSTA